MAAENLGKHKVPTLRNVAKGPSEEFPKAFMHNGAFKSLKEVVHFYNTRDVEDWPDPEVPENVNSDELGDLGLSKKEEVDIVAFMMTLSDGWVPEGGEGDVAMARPLIQVRVAPNPFRGGTAISYIVPNSGHVRMDVFDVAGRRVETLVDGRQDRGTHTARFDRTGHASGVYFFRIETESGISTTKAIALE
jgi:hypothetical protein